jgi:hypothetical protein
MTAPTLPRRGRRLSRALLGWHQKIADKLGRVALGRWAALHWLQADSIGRAFRRFVEHTHQRVRIRDANSGGPGGPPGPLGLTIA